jgi:DNA-binding NtrC family response regulator
MSRILVFDDNRAAQSTCADLARDGHEVFTTASGTEAMRLLRDRTPDAVVMEIRLGAENSLPYLRHMVEADPQLPVIIYSSSSAYRDDFSSWLAAAYIDKEDGTAVLRRMLHDVIAARHARDQSA